MTRAPGSNDFTVDVDGIGTFTFARRQMRDIYRIRGDYNKLTGGNYDEEGNYGDVSALAFVTLSLLMVAAPTGFSLSTLDPLVDDQCDEKVLKVFTALREKELSFRPRPAQAGEGGGEGAAQHVRAGVSAPVQPGAD